MRGRIVIGILAAAALLVLLVGLIKTPGTPTHSTVPGTEVAAQRSADSAPNPQTAALPGDSILQHYARPDGSAQADLRMISHLMQNSLLLLKSAAERPLGGNEDWASMLRGSNAAQERFLSDNSPALDAQGRLVDRWKHPLFIHALGARRFEIRSAGPDGRMWTDDDIELGQDGSFRLGTNTVASPPPR